MMESFQTFIHAHAAHAHWFFLIAVLLAGLGLPISIDLMVLLSALLAATVIPEHTWILFGTLLSGCALSAWIAYWVGRVLGETLRKFPLFKRALCDAHLEKTKRFYAKWGLWTLLIGRFIPFGVRIALFMTTGMSKFSFRTFVLRDALACTIWCSTCFFTFYSLGQNYAVLYHYLKTFNIFILILFTCVGIGFLWYRKSRIRKT